MGAYPISTISKLNFPSFRRMFKFHQNISSYFAHGQPPMNVKRRSADEKKVRVMQQWTMDRQETVGLSIPGKSYPR
jgi:hypothetical protein